MKFSANGIAMRKSAQLTLSKILLIMKLATFMLIISLMQVSAKGFSQINLNVKQIPIVKVLQSIKKQSHYYFIYDENDLKNEKITVKVINATLEQTLSECFKNSQFTYKVIERNVVITPKKQDVPNKLTVSTDSLNNIRGRVVHQNGSPMQGATVILKYRDIALTYITNGNGEFYFNNINSTNGTLLISFIGYLSKEISINDNIEKIVLKPANTELDETRVIAYGSESRRFSVGSTSTLSAAAIEKQPVTNVLLALQGQIPGLTISPANGVPGSSVRVQIRGQNSLQNTGNFSPFDQPLFIIDGVPFATQNNNIDHVSSIAQTGRDNTGFSPFNSVNPNDIESISVLKDADATSIYGTQGANGVILITTKKVKPGKTAFDVAVNSGYSFPTTNFKLLNTQQYLATREEAFKNDGLIPGIGSQYDTNYAPDLVIFDQNKYTDWRKTILGKTAKNIDVHTSLSGGTTNDNFIISTGYTRADYSFPGNSVDKRMTLHSAFHHNSTDNQLSLDFTTDYSYDRNNNIASSSATSGILLPPNLPSLLDPSGNLVWNYKGIDLANYQFYGYLKQPSQLQNYSLNNSLRITYKIATGLSISTNFGYSRVDAKETTSTPALSQDPANFPTSNATFSNSTYQSINIEPQLNYQRTFGKGEFSALIGGTYKRNINQNTLLLGSNYSNDNLLGSISAAGTVYPSNSDNQYKYSAGFGRIKYVYDQKYIISVTGRRDGSSNFGPNHQFGNFGSAGLGWIFSEENGFKQALPFISYAKISANYGTSGSDAIAPYLFQAFWQPSTNIPNFQNIKPYLPANLFNPDYSWGVKKSLNAGLDIGFLNDRLLANITYYRNKEYNQLIDYTLASQAGFTSVLQNFNATVQNTGWEFTLTSNNVKTKDFNWTTSFNISANRNKLLAFPGLAGSSYASFYELGKSTSIVLGYRYKDVNPQTGVFEFYGANGEVTNNPIYAPASQGGERIPVADLQPKFFGGFGNNLSYKQFSLSFFFQFSKQSAPNYLYSLYSYNNTPGTIANLPVQVLGNYWKNPGDNKPLEKLTVGSSDASNAAYNFTQSSGAYSDDTYLRLKTLSLSYTLPDSYLKKLDVKNCRFFVNGQNLLTITNYKVGDPEQPGIYSGFPIQRTIVFGLSFNL